MGLPSRTARLPGRENWGLDAQASILQAPPGAVALDGARTRAITARGGVAACNRRHARANRQFRFRLSARFERGARALGTDRTGAPQRPRAPAGCPTPTTGRLLHRRRAPPGFRRASAAAPRHRCLGHRPSAIAPSDPPSDSLRGDRRTHPLKRRCSLGSANVERPTGGGPHDRIHPFKPPACCDRIGDIPCPARGDLDAAPATALRPEGAVLPEAATLPRLSDSGRSRIGRWVLRLARLVAEQERGRRPAGQSRSNFEPAVGSCFGGSSRTRRASRGRFVAVRCLVPSGSRPPHSIPFASGGLDPYRRHCLDGCSAISCVRSPGWRRDRITIAHRKDRALAPVIRRRQMNACRAEHAGAVARNFCKKRCGGASCAPATDRLHPRDRGMCSHITVV